MISLSEWQGFEKSVAEFIAEQVRTLGDVRIRDRRSLEPEDWHHDYFVSSENEVRARFVQHISPQVNEMLKSMNYDGRFRANNGKIAVGYPDLVWVQMNTCTGIICVEVKTPWHLGNITNIISQASSGKPEDEHLRNAVVQIYTYMTVSGLCLHHLILSHIQKHCCFQVNQHKYGVLTTYDSTWLLRRVGESSGELEVAGPFESTPLEEILSIQERPARISVVGALTYMLYLTKSSWLHASPPHKARCLANVAHFPITYDVIEYSIKEGMIVFSAHVETPTNAQIHRGYVFGRSEEFILKVVDCFDNEGLLNELENEVKMYKELESLQGILIPRFMGHFALSGVLRILALQDCGVYVPTYELTALDEKNIRAKLSLLHRAGFVHGDAAHRHFVKNRVGEWKLLDFGRTRRSRGKKLRKKDVDSLEESWDFE